VITAISLLAIVVSFVAKTQVIIKPSFLARAIQAVGSLILLSLPLLALQFNPDLGSAWKNNLYFLSFALTVLLVVTKIKDWEKMWPIIILWPLLPFVYTSDNLGLWLAMITAEFLLLMSFLEHPFRSDYHKYGLIRILVIFQYFVFENLFLTKTDAWSSEILTLILLILYSLSLYNILVRLRLRDVGTWIFLIAYLQYGIMMFDKIIPIAFSLPS
jgi:hypothetical protein